MYRWAAPSRARPRHSGTFPVDGASAIGARVRRESRNMYNNQISFPQVLWGTAKPTLSATTSTANTYNFTCCNKGCETAMVIRCGHLCLTVHSFRKIKVHCSSPQCRYRQSLWSFKWWSGLLAYSKGRRDPNQRGAQSPIRMSVIKITHHDCQSHIKLQMEPIIKLYDFLKMLRFSTFSTKMVHHSLTYLLTALLTYLPTY